MLAVALALACALAVALAWIGRVEAPPASPAITAKSVRQLPARPEDIEAHGTLAQSVLPPDDARRRNDLVPFANGPISTAAPFAFKGSDEDRARATECLATAVLYEAGDDTVGQAAVAQVVLNRVRHAAFPATVCGVVYQGQERSTGCQFTFTCDGSLARRMPDAAWERARQVARRAIAGWVDRTVGLATHYHTNWVYPYWSPQLSKLAQVGTHLFFGWPGSWGGPRAFGRAYRGGERGPAAMAASVAADPAVGLLPEDIGGETPKILGLPQAKAQLPADLGSVPLYGARVKLVGMDGRAFGLLAPAGADGAKLVNAAMALCSRPGPCQVSAWGNEDDIPGSYPISEGARGTMVFEYRRIEGTRGTTRFDCARYPNRDPQACLASSGKTPALLSGVRFKSDESPAITN